MTKLSPAEAMKKVLDENPSANEETTYARNLSVFLAIRRLEIPIFFRNEFLHKFSIDSLLAIRREILHGKMGKPASSNRPFIPPINEIHIPRGQEGNFLDKIIKRPFSTY